MTVKDGCLKAEVRDNGLVNYSVNIFFESHADDFVEMGIGIILSGGGDDGLLGAKKIKKWV